MTNPISYPNQQIPTNYSGVTIHITNPTVNATPQGGCYQASQPGIYATPNYSVQPQTQSYVQQGNYYAQPQPQPYAAPQENFSQQPQIIAEQVPSASNSSAQNEAQQISTEKTSSTNTETLRETQYAQNPIKKSNQETGAANSYPPQYYLNNYNYIQGSDAKNNGATASIQAEPAKNSTPEIENQTQEEKNLETSNKIINELDAREAEQKELEKKSKKKRIVALTDEYIMSLENYLNNPNTELRLMASKEVLTRLDEDRDRYDNAALNALLNKMLQDPEKLVRIAALSAFSSQLASGNDYTETLLKQIQENPNADKEDVLEASTILLKRSAETEIKYVPANKDPKQQPQNNPNPELMKGAN